MSHDKLLEKINAEFIKYDASFIQSLSDKISECGFPQDMIFNGSDESKKAIFEWISGLANIPSKKVTSPKTNNTPKKEAWLDPKELILKVREHQAIIDNWDGEGEKPEIKQWCLHRAAKGANKNKACGKELTGPPASGNIYANKCTACSKNNSEKAIIKLQDFYESLLAGSEVKGSPTGNYNVPADEVPDFNVAEMAGIKDGVTSPTGPKEFLGGKKIDAPSPSGAKGKKRSPKNFKLREIKAGKTDDYQDCYSKEDVNGNTWMVRKTLDPVKYEIGGKFSGIKSDFDADYLNFLHEIEGDEMEKVSEIGITYRFMGRQSTPESEDEANLDDSGDDEIDDLLESI
tara:strand:- start:148 stop:1182 length:1035 start_codon:yes stop_codon:yes gene_type:complete